MRIPAPSENAIALSRRYPVSRESSVRGVIVEAERTRRPRVSSMSLSGMRLRDSSRSRRPDIICPAGSGIWFQHLKGGRTHGQRQQSDPDRKPREGPGDPDDPAGNDARALLARDHDDLEGRLGRQAGDAPSGTTSWRGRSSRRSAASTSTRARWSTSKAACRPGAGKTRTGRSATRPRSRPPTS